MVKLKSYRLKGTLKKKNKRKRKSRSRDIVTGATGAIIGTAFVAQTANVLKTL